MSKSLEVSKTRLIFQGESEPHLVDTIFLEGAWWLVASWIAQYTTRERAPERLVRLTGLDFREVQGERYRFDLNIVIPRSVFDGEAQAGFVVATNPVLADSPAPTDRKRH